MGEIAILNCLISARELERSEQNLFVHKGTAGNRQQQTSQAFAEKWNNIDYESDDFAKACARQRAWYLELYGFNSEQEFGEFLRRSPSILDAGTGTGAKAAWFASLAPGSVVIAAEVSDAVHRAANHYRSVENLNFIKCDIGGMAFIPEGSFDYVSCDQVIHHTTNPARTFDELVRVTRTPGDISCYVYRRKALPRELLDDRFRHLASELTHDELFELSEQVTDLGELLSTVGGEFDFPAIPALEITGGRMSLQRFVYWNFLKCFWDSGLGRKNSVLTNFDWYSPSQAFRFREEEFLEWIKANALEIVHFHREHACYSGRFRKREESTQAD